MTEILNMPEKCKDCRRTMRVHDKGDAATGDCGRSVWVGDDRFHWGEQTQICVEIQELIGERKLVEDESYRRARMLDDFVGLVEAYKESGGGSWFDGLAAQASEAVR